MDDNRIGVRELRQTLSACLRRVSAGETLVVTDHRRPVAVLAPLPAPESEPKSILDRMIARGEALRGIGGLLDVVPYAGPVLMSSEEALEIDKRNRI